MKYMNKKGLEFRSAFFSIIVVSMVIIATGIIVNGWGERYGSGITYDLGGYDYLSNMTNEGNSQEGKLNQDVATTDSDFESSTYRGIYRIIINIYGPFKIVFGNDGMVDSITERFGLPDYVRWGITTMMVMAITFTLVAIIFRMTGRKTTA